MVRRYDVSNCLVLFRCQWDVVTTPQKGPTHWRISGDVVMTSQCGPRRPNLNETKMRRRYDVACWVGYLFMLTGNSLWDWQRQTFLSVILNFWEPIRQSTKCWWCHYFVVTGLINIDISGYGWATVIKFAQQVHLLERSQSGTSAGPLLLAAHMTWNNRHISKYW